MNNKYITKLIWSSLIILIFFICDRILKYVFLFKISDYRDEYLNGIFGFALQKNEGISYGLPLANWATIIATALIILVIIYFIVKVSRNKEWNFYYPLFLILMGAASNFIDRLRFGYVIDMLIFNSWISFNLADLMILVGAGWLVINFIRLNKLDQDTKG